MAPVLEFFAKRLIQGGLPVRMAELAGKEIVNIYNGARLGVVGETDLAVDIESGEISSIILPKRGNFISMWVDRSQQLVIPWEAVRKIGEEVIIVDLDQTSPAYGRRFF